MNKDLNFNFNKHHDEVLAGLVVPPKDEVPEKQYSDSDALLKAIYQIGSDGYPVGDLAVFVGKNASPEVKKFILDNLMCDVSSAANPASMNLSDDEIATLTRHSEETMADYAARLNQSISKDTYILNVAKRNVQAAKAAKQKQAAE